MAELDEKSLINELMQAISELPDTRVTLEETEAIPPYGERADAIAHVRSGGSSYWLLIEAKRNAYPRDVREALWQLRNYLAHAEPARSPWVPLLAAESISPGAREILREEKVGYYDTGGSLYLPAPGAFVLIERPPPKQARRVAQSLFSGRSAHVLQAAWSRGDAWFGVNELAQLASVSPATASTTLAALERNDWVASHGSGPAKQRRLSDRKALLDAWTEHQLSSRPPPAQRYFVPSGQVEDIVRRIDVACEMNAISYEITGEAAGQFYAPYLSHVSQVRCRIEAGPRLDNVLRDIEARRVTEGWNLAILSSTDIGKFSMRTRGDGCWYASALQTYLDLLQAGGRAKDLAMHLRHEQLGA